MDRPNGARPRLILSVCLGEEAHKRKLFSGCRHERGEGASYNATVNLSSGEDA